MRRPYHTLLNLLVLSIIIFIVVDVFYTIVRGKLRPVNTKKVLMPFLPEVKGHQRPPFDDYRLIMERNIFGFTEKEAEQVEEEEIEASEPTSLKVALLGTAVGDLQSPVAVIMEPGKRIQNFYRVGDTIQDAVVKKIMRGKVIVRVRGKDEILIMEEGTRSKPEKKPPAPRPTRREATRTIRRSEMQGSLKNINKLLSQARIRPHFKGGKADGLSLTRVKADSIFAKMGLRDGDILQEINGRSIKRPDDIHALYKRLKSGTRLSLKITRKNQPKTINYRFR